MLQLWKGYYRRVPTVIPRKFPGIAVLCLLSLSTACSSGKAANEAKPVAPAQPITQVLPNNQVIALGRLVPKGEVIKISVVNARDSRVNQLMVKEGDFVKANQVIAVLQGKDRAEQQLRDAMANVAIKQSQLLKIKQGDFKQGEVIAQKATIAELEARLVSETQEKKAAIAEAQAMLRNAKIKHERNDYLIKEGAISNSDVDNTKEEFDRARAKIAQTQADFENTKSILENRLAQEKANLQRLQEVRPVDVEIAQAQLEQALIQVEQRKAELDDTKVRVPIAGQILRINTRVGEQVNTAEGIAELGQTKQMYVLAEVYESDILKVQLGQKATISSEYGGFQGEIKGKVEQIGLQIGKTRLNSNQNNPTNDVNARVVEVRIPIDSKDSPKVAALTGMQVRVKIDTQPKIGRKE